MAGIATNDTGDNSTALQRLFTLAASLRLPVRLREGEIVAFATGMQAPDNLTVIGRGELHYTGSTGSGVRIVGNNIKIGEGITIRLDAPKTITGITQANPGVITLAADPGWATSDEVSIFLGPQSGMQEINARIVTLTRLTGTTYSIAVDTSGYSAFSGEAVALKYVSGHRGVFCQRSTFSPFVQVYASKLDLSGLTVIGAGESGIRADWVRELDLSGVTVRRCGLHGILSLSCIRGVARGQVTCSQIGPGVEGTMYGCSFSRAYSSPALNLTDAPPPGLIHFDAYVSEDIPYYAGFDVHSASKVSIGHFRTRNCHMGFNFEHGTGSEGEATAIDVIISSYDCEGPNPSYFDIGPAFAIDAQSGAGEIARGISIGNGAIRRHGYQDTFGNAVFATGGAFYIRNAVVEIGKIDARDCYARVVWVGQSADVGISALTSAGLIDVGGVQRVVETTSATGIVRIDNVTANAGEIIKAAHAGNVFLGANLVLLGTATLMDASASTVIDYGPGRTSPQIIITTDGTPTVIWQKQLFKDWGAVVAKTSTGIFTVTLSGVFNNARIGLLASAQAAQQILYNNLSSTANEVRFYNSSGVLFDPVDITFWIWGE
jgi:hypothetical protein